MIAPDLFKIPPPREHVQYSVADSGGPTIKSVISKHFLNHSVITVFPDTMHIPSELKDIFTNDTEYYLLESCPLHLLVEYQFIEAFAINGEITMLSTDTLLDVDSCCCITPTGYLLLSVHRSEFLKLGIEKGPAVDVIYLKKSNRYVICINLRQPCFKPDKNNYKRVLKQLLLWNWKTNMIINWEPKDIRICPSSVASYFSKKGVKCEECNPSLSEKRFYNVNVPLFQSNSDQLFEWLGLFLLDALVERSQDESEYLSSYQVPEESDSVGQVLVLQLTGLYTANKVEKLWNLIRGYIAVRSSIPWIGMHVHGFEDSPVSWSLNPHHHSVFGDNNYTLICNQNGSLKACKVFTSLKSCS